MKNAVFWDVATCRTTQRHIPENGILHTFYSLHDTYPYYPLNMYYLHFKAHSPLKEIT
jgi:hypothetical protein